MKPVSPSAQAGSPRLRDVIGVENIALEADYPHSDSSWPEGPEKLWQLVADLDPDGRVLRDIVPDRDAAGLADVDGGVIAAGDEVPIDATVRTVQREDPVFAVADVRSSGHHEVSSVFDQHAVAGVVLNREPAETKSFNRRRR